MSHDHGHATVTMTRDLRRAFPICVVLNVAFVPLEAVFGVLAHSTALARRTPSSLHTYGFRRSTVLAALANAVLLLAAVGAVAWEAIGRFGTPKEPHGKMQP